jgi:hypothetical protein
MALTKKDEQKLIAKVFCYLCGVSALAAVVLGVVFWQIGTTMVKTVNKGLTEQKVYFPPKGSPGFDPGAFGAAQKYAGKQVTDGALAKVYAEDYLGVQLNLIGGGKTLSEVSAQAAANPTNPALQQQQAVMFQLVTSKNLFLATGYGTWAQGMLVRSAGIAALGVAVLLAFASLVKFMYYKKS